MKELVAFLLPPALAFCGARICRALLGREFDYRFGAGLRWALGLAVGMLVFTQAALLGTLAGVNPATPLAWVALIWGLGEIMLQAPRALAWLPQLRFQTEHLWLLLLLPVLYWCWVFARLSTLEGTMELDANAFWVFKAKVLYLDQGRNLLFWMHQPGLAYAHWEYPLLVPCLYLLDYGAVGGVDEFVNKVWPFWMVVGLCVGILSLTKTWQRPHPLPVLAIVVLCFLPATLDYVRQEGGTIPMLFFASLTAMLLVKAITQADESRQHLVRRDSFGHMLLVKTIAQADEWYLAAAMLTAAGVMMSKFEGMIYTAFWFCVLLPICWKRGWLKKGILWRTALACAICLLPFVWYRLEKPIQHPEAHWWREGLATSAATLHRFPQVLFLNTGSRFFNGDFFRWQPGGQGHLDWVGQWAGFGSLVNEQLTLLPWLLLILVLLALWHKRSRLATASLSAVVLGVLVVLALTLSCLPYIQNDPAMLVHYSGPDEVGRYSYPFFTAWFLGVMIIWFDTRRMKAPNVEPASRRRSAK